MKITSDLLDWLSRSWAEYIFFLVGFGGFRRDCTLLEWKPPISAHSTGNTVSSIWKRNDADYAVPFSGDHSRNTRWLLDFEPNHHFSLVNFGQSNQEGILCIRVFVYDDIRVGLNTLRPTLGRGSGSWTEETSQQFWGLTMDSIDHFHWNKQID